MRMKCVRNSRDSIYLCSLLLKYKQSLLTNHACQLTCFATWSILFLKNAQPRRQSRNTLTQDWHEVKLWETMSSSSLSAIVWKTKPQLIKPSSSKRLKCKSADSLKESSSSESMKLSLPTTPTKFFVSSESINCEDSPINSPTHHKQSVKSSFDFTDQRVTFTVGGEWRLEMITWLQNILRFDWFGACI